MPQVQDPPAAATERAQRSRELHLLAAVNELAGAEEEELEAVVGSYEGVDQQVCAEDVEQAVVGDVEGDGGGVEGWVGEDMEELDHRSYGAEVVVN